MTRAVLGTSSIGCSSTAYLCASLELGACIKLRCRLSNLTACIMFAEPAEAAVPEYPPPPGAPASTPSTQDPVPPPSYNQAVQQSTKHGKPAHGISHAVVTIDETEQASRGSSPSGSPSGKRQDRTGSTSEAAARMSSAGGVQLHGSHLEAIDRSAEEALQIQVDTAGVVCLI